MLIFGFAFGAIILFISSVDKSLDCAVGFGVAIGAGEDVSAVETNKRCPGVSAVMISLARARDSLHAECR